MPCGGQRLSQAGEVDKLHAILFQLFDDVRVGEQPQLIRSRCPQACFDAVQFGVFVSGMAHQLARAGGQSFDQIDQPGLRPESGAGDSEEKIWRLRVRLLQPRVTDPAQLRYSERAGALPG